VLSKAADLSRANGQYGDAEAWYRQALGGRIDALGADHHETIWSVNNLAVCINDQVGCLFARQEAFGWAWRCDLERLYVPSCQPNMLVDGSCPCSELLFQCRTETNT
jgi:hypothetical protein